MIDIQFELVQPDDQQSIELIADWYLTEWKIPFQVTVEKLKAIRAESPSFQYLMKVNGTPVSTGGMYDHVGLLDRVPRLSQYKHWLALVYTLPGERRKGYGASLCEQIRNFSKSAGIDAIYLFTDSAERLYQKLGWIEIERLSLSNRNIVVMKKSLNEKNG